MNVFLEKLAAVCLLVGAAACSRSEAQQSADTGWPIQIERDGARIVIYQLQPESLTGDKLTGRAAVSITRYDAPEPIFGAVWIEARIATDRDARMVTLLDVQVPSVKFPAATQAEQDDMVAIVRAELPRQHPSFALDELVATLDPAVQVDGADDALRHDPPRIVFVTRPTALVTIDGQPELREIEGSKLMRVVNTPFIILFDPAQKTHWIRAGKRWMRAGALAGPWQVEPNPPQSVVSAVPPSTVAQEPATTGAQTDDVDIVVATEPTEVIVARGEPRWSPIAGDDLMYLVNSESDVFLVSATHEHYVLLSGRWYASPSLEKGPWKWVASDRLPGAFARIPAGSPKADVRTFVAGTEEAREAVLDASIPQTAAIKRSDASCTVTYDGEPRFEDIPGTSLGYAVNTSSSVIESESRYYCCSDGVWYVADAPLGPWSVATAVPAGVEDIPPSSPVYPVKYVYVYDSTPEYVYVGYLPAYTGCYVAGPTIVYGTGWWYHGWIGHAYYPHPWTWGFHAYYDPWHPGWSFGVGYAWGWNPWWFNHSCGWGHPGWWGPGGFHGKSFAIHGSVVRSVAASAVAQGQTAVPAGRENLYRRPENRARAASVPGMPAVPSQARRVAPSVPNDVFTDREGRVMRRSRDGWDERQQQEWKRATPQPAPTGPGAGRLGRQPPPSEGRPQPTPPGREQPAPPERERPVTPPVEREHPAPPVERPLPPVERPLPPVERPIPPIERPVPPPVERERPVPERPPVVVPPARPPVERPVPPAPRPPRPTLRPTPDGDTFERQNQARERGNTRASNARQQRPAGRGPGGG